MLRPENALTHNYHWQLVFNTVFSKAVKWNVLFSIITPKKPLKKCACKRYWTHMFFQGGQLGARCCYRFLGVFCPAWRGTIITTITRCDRSKIMHQCAKKQGGDPWEETFTPHALPQANEPSFSPVWWAPPEHGVHVIVPHSGGGEIGHVPAYGGWHGGVLIT